MKVLVLLLLVPMLSLSQSKGDTKIIVTASDTAKLFTRITSMLYEKGFNLVTKDPEAGFISTDAIGVGKHPGKMKLRVMIKGEQVTFSGDVAVKIAVLGMSENDLHFGPLKYVGMKGSLNKDAWGVMDQLSRSLGAVTYGK